MNPALRSSPLDDAIPTIPYAAIAAFLSRPTLLGRDEIKHAPYVLAFPDEHQAAGEAQVVYARGLAQAASGARYSVMHVADPIVDLESGKTLGYAGIYTATRRRAAPGRGHTHVAGRLGPRDLARRLHGAGREHDAAELPAARPEPEGPRADHCGR